MPIRNRLADLHDEITGWRRDIHAHPELQFDVERTAGFVADKLREFGVDEVVEGIGRTGVVAIIKGKSQSSGKVIGLRADMDALPIIEATSLPYASTVSGRMHACGHDGHTAMLLGAAKYLSETRNFDGSVAVIFQPAEEGGAGGKFMVEDGMMERFGIQQVYGMHNMPGMPIGQFATRVGPLMASTAEFVINIEGKGGHAAMPHMSIDTTLVASHLTVALQSIVSRNADPKESLVLTVTAMHTEGDSFNVIPQKAKLQGTVRALTSEMQDLAEQKINLLAEHTCQAFGATAQVNFTRGYPVTVCHEAETRFSVDVAKHLVGDDRVDGETRPLMGAEDFSYMLEARPGSFIFIGNGDTANVHHPEYDFNDDAIPFGCSYWADRVESSMPAS